MFNLFSGTVNTYYVCDGSKNNKCKTVEEVSINIQYMHDGKLATKFVDLMNDEVYIQSTCMKLLLRLRRCKSVLVS